MVELAMEKLEKLEEELRDLEKRLAHMASEYAATKSGSAYGVEYFEIQVKVYQEMVEGVKKEILELKKNRRKNF